MTGSVATRTRTKYSRKAPRSVSEIMSETMEAGEIPLLPDPDREAAVAQQGGAPSIDLHALALGHRQPGRGQHDVGEQMAVLVSIVQGDATALLEIHGRHSRT